jgi:hypothetical protein
VDLSYGRGRGHCSCSAGEEKLKELLANAINRGISCGPMIWSGEVSSFIRTLVLNPNP